MTMTSGRDPILSIYDKDQNGQCHVCDGEEDDAPPLLMCSFCNVAVQNSNECLGQLRGGTVISAQAASTTELEW